MLAYFWAWSDKGDGVQGGPFYTALYKNAFSPSLWVLGIAGLLLVLSLLVRRPFCDALCPIGATSDLASRLLRRHFSGPVSDAAPVSLVRRRQFLERSAAGAGAVLLGGEALSEFALGAAEPALGVGFRNDAPDALGDVARPAAFASHEGDTVRCQLCPHECILGENDRGFCRTRVVKGGKLHTLAYGNLCSEHLDPMEKKPLYHFLPSTPIVSVAMGGCNLRCLNCQNWEISQARPNEVATQTLLPAALARETREQGAIAVAYTYSEPLMAYEYVRDSAAVAREQGLKNVLVTAGYINERPLRELCRVIDAVTLDVKAFREAFYREVSGARLAPVLRTLEVLREEGVWTEVSFLMVPSLSDDPQEIGDFAAWVAKHLGTGTPLHILRFHPAHRLKHLPPTPVAAMEQAHRRARDAGLDYVYLGNVPGHDSNHTRCPKDGRILIERHGFEVRDNRLIDGRCPCGERIPGVFSV
ncbi:MAG: AmmeMemoRadiSam system radical SAM enzyme [Polyangiaceae bacterium]